MNTNPQAQQQTYKNIIQSKKTIEQLSQDKSIEYLAEQLDEINGLEIKIKTDTNKLEKDITEANKLRDQLLSTYTQEQIQNLENINDSKVNIYRNLKENIKKQQEEIAENQTNKLSIQNSLKETYKYVNYDETKGVWSCTLSYPIGSSISGIQDLYNLSGYQQYNKYKELYGEQPDWIPAAAYYNDSLSQKDKDFISENICKKLENGEEISNEDWQQFYNLHSNSDSVYNEIVDKYMSQNFRHNINTTLDASLVDIRNYHNFRNSNTKSSAIKGADDKTMLNVSTADSTCASKSFYMSKNDFFWSQNYNVIKDEPTSVQNIILNEYQPHMHYNLGLELAVAIDNGGGMLLDKAQDWFKGQFSNGNVANFVLNIGAKIGQQGAIQYYNEQLSALSQNPDSLYNEVNDDKGTNPMYFVERLFSRGKWLNTYQLPFVAGGKVLTNYLPDVKGGEWNIGGLADHLNSSNNGQSLVQKVLQNKISLNIPTSPTFNMNNATQSTYDSFTIDFYLINKSDHYLGKNFEFLHALFAGTQWLTMNQGFIVAPNVYNVYVPGRFMIHWAKMTMNVKAEGKLRMNDYMYATYNNRDDIQSIEYDTLWPEAWHISLSITPLSQWNFNTYIDYHKHGFGYKRKQRLYKATQTGNMWDQLFTNSQNVRQVNKNLLQQVTDDIKALQKDLYNAKHAEDEFSTQHIQDLFKRRQQLIEQVNDRIAYIKQHGEQIRKYNPDINLEEAYGITEAKNALANLDSEAQLYHHLGAGVVGEYNGNQNNDFWTDVGRIFNGYDEKDTIRKQTTARLQLFKTMAGDQSLDNKAIIKILQEDANIIQKGGYSNQALANTKVLKQMYDEKQQWSEAQGKHFVMNIQTLDKNNTARQQEIEDKQKALTLGDGTTHSVFDYDPNGNHGRMTPF